MSMKKNLYLLGILASILAASFSKAQVLGPAQPEYTAIKPIETGNLVNEFSGSFNYSIPVVTIPGTNGLNYPMTLVYSSGKTPNEAASWVGYGWDLNPGAIIRQKRGLPDDFKNRQVIHWNRDIPNVTIEKRINASYELFSSNTFGINSALIKNNRSGVTTRIGFLAGIKETGNNWNGRYGLDMDSKGNIFLTHSNNMLEEFKRGSLFGELSTFEEVLVRTVFSSMFTNDYNILGNILSPVPYPSVSPEYSGEQINYKPTFSIYGLETDFALGGSVRTITMKERSELNAYGYFYNEAAENDATALIDYYKENESSIDSRDKYLPLSFASKDNFAISGQGLQGTFQAYKNTVTWVRPNAVESTTNKYDFGVTEGVSATDVQYGINGQYGYDALSIDGWKAGFSQPGRSGDFMFKMVNDMVPSYLYNKNTPTQTSSILEAPIDPGTSLLSSSYAYSNGNPNDMCATPSTFSNKSVDISYYTVGDLNKMDAQELALRNMRKQYNILGVDDNILGAFTVINKDGTRYNYSIPVFNRNERELSYGVNKEGANGAISIVKNLVYMNTVPNPVDENGVKIKSGVNSPKILRGEENNEPYAGSFLLTEIYTPDYVDITGDGPTPDDLGGYVLFNYRRAAGSDLKSDTNKASWQFANKNGDYKNTWYKWRYPYTGMFYERGSLSDYQDDMGNVSMGETELYYLQSIETKTHIAYFVTNKTDVVIGKDYSISGSPDIRLTGSKTERKDGYPAFYYEYKANGAQPADYPLTGVNQVEYLEKISLYAKQSLKEGDKNNTNKLTALIQTTYFDYDQNYPIWNNQPNSIGNVGKLTLKRIWMENNNVKNYAIAPYEFKYQYDLSIFNGLPSVYDGLKSQVNSEYPATLFQNPAYNPVDIDRWGNYRFNGISQYAKLNNWVDQKPDPNYDPAAWNLKSIILPSAGQLHIQYEQNEYSYVQNKNAMVMVPINSMDGADGKIKIQLTDILGSNASDASVVNAFDNLGQQYFMGKTGTQNYSTKDKAYFKILYSLSGDIADINKCNSEFISGYGELSEWTVDRSTGYLTLRFAPIANMTNIFKTNSNFPQEVCLDYYNSQRNGLLSSNTYYDAAKNTPYVTAADLSSASGFVTRCFNMTYNNSYVRLPIPVNIAKKGGGIRVKRVLTYDPFDVVSGENSGNKLFGAEYIYRTKTDNLPSGVATNEPGLGSDENALITCFDNHSSSVGISLSGLASTTINPKHYEQFLGPFGKSLLPGGSVGYSSVIKKSIYDGAANGGVSVKTYYTCKDYPQKAIPGAIYKSNSNYPDFLATYGKAGASKFIGDFVVDVNVNEAWQAYSIIRNSMHGAMRREELYQGLIGSDSKSKNRFNDLKRVGFTEYTYFEPGEKVKIFKYDDEFSSIFNKSYFLGVDQDVVIETRKLNQTTISPKADIDLHVQLAVPPVIYPTGSFNANYIKNELRTAVSTNVVTYPIILKSVVSEFDGLRTVNDNVAFDYYTGAPCVTRTYDGYDGLVLDATGASHDGSYTTINISAVNEIKDLGPISHDNRAIKSTSEYNISRRVSLKDAQTNTFHLVVDFNSTADNADLSRVCWPCKVMDRFQRGDIIEIVPKDVNPSIGSQEYYQVLEASGNVVALQPIWNSSTVLKPYSLMECDVYLLKSAKTNQLTLPSTSITTYGNSTAADLGIAKVVSSIPGTSYRAQFVDALNTAVIDAAIGNPVNINTRIPSSLLKNLKFKGLSDVSPFVSALSASDFISITTAALPQYTHAVQVKVSVKKTNAASSSSFYVSQGAYDLKDDWNRFLTNSYQMTVNSILPETNSLFSSSGNRYVVTKITNTALKTKIYEAAGLYRITNAKYEISGSLSSGLSMAYPYGDVEVVIDNQARKILLNKLPVVSSYYGMTLGVDRKLTNGSSPADFAAVFSSDYATATRSDFSISSNTSNTIDYTSGGTGFTVYSGIKSSANSSALWSSMTLRYDTFHSLNDLYGRFKAFSLSPDGRILINHTSNDITVYDPINTPDLIPYPITWCDKLSILEFEDEDNLSNFTISNVVSAQAVKYSDNWTGLKQDVGNLSNIYATGAKGRWFKHSEYVYKSDINNHMVASAIKQRVHSSGLIKNPITIFNPSNQTNANWFKKYEITKYLPDGKVVESKDVFGIKSAIKYGWFMGSNKLWNKELPVAFGVNAGYDDLYTDAFESKTTSSIYDATQVHTGLSAVNIISTGTNILTNVPLGENLSANGGVCRFWYKASGVATPSLTVTGIDGAIYTVPTQIPSALITINGWTLYESEITSFGSTSTITATISGSGKLDDFVLKPVNATVTAFAHDVFNQRMMAKLDDNDFAMIFQYNPEGRMVRMMMETPMGVRTISENHYNVPPRVNRTDNSLPQVKSPVTGGSLPSSGSSSLPNPDALESALPDAPVIPDQFRQEDVRSLDIFNDKNPKCKIPTATGDSIKQKFELFELQMDPNGSKIKNFDLEKFKEELLDSVKIKTSSDTTGVIKDSSDGSYNNIKRYQDEYDVITNQETLYARLEEAYNISKLFIHVFRKES